MSNSLSDNGYTILKNVFSEDALAGIRDLTQRVTQYAERGLEDPFSKYYLRHRADQGVLYDLYHRHPAFRVFAENHRILDALETALGPDIYLYENSLIYKPPGKHNGVPWHQDFISRPDEPVKYIVWMALDRATRANGCVKVIPGSHKSGFLPWHRVEGETHHDRVNPECVDESKAMYVELDAGDVLIFNQLLLHSSDEVDTDQPRRAYRVSYQGLDTVFTPRSTPIVLRGGEPESLASRYNKPYVEQPKVEISPGVAKRVLHAVGWRLLRI